jgi:hypothetical protein
VLACELHVAVDLNDQPSAIRNQQRSPVSFVENYHSYPEEAPHSDTIRW